MENGISGLNSPMKRDPRIENFKRLKSKTQDLLKHIG